MTHGSLFSGIGGFDLAAQWMGWENVFHCEKEPFCQKVLKYYWPKAIQYSNIKTTDFKVHENSIDIISGGFPCQPYSTAGKRLGKEDERHLWPEMLRAIREISPRWVVGENVRGHTNWNGGVVFDEVQADLEAEGYEVLPFLLPACAVNAPHRRDRIWFVAYASGSGVQINQSGIVSNINRNDQGKTSARKQQGWNRANGEGGATANAANKGLAKREQPGRESTQKENGTGVDNRTANDGINGTTTDTDSIIGRKRGLHKAGPGTTERHAGSCDSRHDRGAWQDFPTVSPLCNGNDGISAGLDTDTISFAKWRNESVKAGGNAIVPQIAYEIFKAIEQHEIIEGERRVII